jgi:hypothetical protein
MEQIEVTVRVDKVDDRHSVAHLKLYRPKYEEGFSYEEAVASVSPGDSFDERLGAMLAGGRALEKMGKRLQKKAWDQIKEKDRQKEIGRAKKEKYRLAFAKNQKKGKK